MPQNHREPNVQGYLVRDDPEIVRPGKGQELLDRLRPEDLPWGQQCELGTKSIRCDEAGRTWPVGFDGLLMRMARVRAETLASRLAIRGKNSSFAYSG